MSTGTFDQSKQLADRRYGLPSCYSKVGSSIGDVDHSIDYSKVYYSDISTLFVAFSGEDIIDQYDNSSDAEYGSYAEITPLSEGVNGDPSIKDLNPFERHNFNSDGYLLFGTVPYGGQPNSGGCAPSGAFSIASMRGIGLRVPIMLSGWGYDTDGNPTFSTYDDKLPGGSGIRTGPLDIRWDSSRHVWVASGGSSLPVHRHLSEADGGVAFSSLYPVASGDVSDSGLIHVIPADLVVS